MKLLVTMFLLLATINLHAEVYKWVDEKGRVYYSDTKPADETIQVETMEVSAINIDEQGHVVQKAIDAKKEAAAAAAAEARKKKSQSKQKPKPKVVDADVEIFTAPWCGYCKMAIAFLEENGVPYQEHDISADRSAALRQKQLSGGGGIPFAIINGQNIKGWNEGAYTRALDL